MPIEIEAPDGSIVEFPDGTTDDVISQAMQQTFGPPTGVEPSEPVQTTDKTGRLQAVDQAKADRDKYYSSGIYAGAYNPLGPIIKSLDAGATAATRAPLFGWDDELVAGAKTLGGFAGDYSKAQQEEDAKKQAMRQQNPVSSIVGDVGGGLVTGKALPSLSAGRSLPLIGRAGAAGAEAAGYGALTGAGEAQQGERGKGAAIGALIGGATGVVASKLADKLATRAAMNTANASAPSADELKSASQSLYDQAYRSGVGINQQAADRMVSNMEMVAGKANANLRPKTLGVVEDIQALKSKPMDLQTFHELRQEIDLAARGAEPGDARTLARMRDVLNSFADNVQQSHLTGPKQGLDTFREADALWAKRTKVQKLEDLFDLADVKSGRYSQSGVENALRDKASQLYTQIVKGKEKSFTKEEVELIRQLAKAETSPKLLKWVAKFAPRGVVSAGLGTGIGASIGTTLAGPVGGAVGFAVPGALGMGAANLVDRSALNTMRSLTSAAATGNAPVTRQISQAVNPLLQPLGSISASQAVRSR